MNTSRQTIVAVVTCAVLGLSLAFLAWSGRNPTRHMVTVVKLPAPPPAKISPADFNKILASKNPAALSAAAHRIPLATVMHWYGQSRFTDGTIPGSMSIPDDCLAEAKPDAKLSAWLTTWRQNLRQGHQATTTSRDSLANLLKDSPLPSPALLDIGRAVDFLSDDHSTTARFYAAAAYPGAKEAVAAKSEPLRYRSILLGLNSARPLLWDAIDGGQRDLAPALQVLCSTVAQWTPSGDPILDGDCQFARIDSAECLYLSGKYDQALEVLDNIQHRKLTQRQQLGADWASGLVFYQVRQYDQAVPHLQNVVDEGGKRSTEAAPLLVISLVRCGNVEDAKKVYDNLLASGQQPAQLTQAMLALNGALRRSGKIKRDE